MKKILNIVTVTVTTCVLIGLVLWMTTALFYSPIPVTGMESIKEVAIKNDIVNLSFISLLYVKLFIVFLAIIAVSIYQDRVCFLSKK